MKVKDIIVLMNRYAPENLAESWDNVGLIIGRREDKVTNILAALDLTDEVLDEALANRCNLIITHHPPIFKSLAKINSDSYKGELLLKTIQNGISVYSSHTNLDIAHGGTADALAELLEIKEIESVIYGENPENYFGRAGVFDEQMSLRQLAELVKNRLNLDSIRFCGNENQIIKKIAIATGSSADINYIQQAKAFGCHAYITGDISYHSAQEAVYSGLCLVDATHFASENLVLKKIKGFLEAEMKKSGLTADFRIAVSEFNGQIFKNV